MLACGPGFMTLHCKPYWRKTACTVLLLCAWPRLNHVLCVLQPQDVLFGLVKQLFMKRATDPSLHVPKIVVMSATLDAGKFSEFFDDCPVCEVEGRLFPVDIVYRNVITAEDLKSPPSYSKQVTVIFQHFLGSCPGIRIGPFIDSIFFPFE